MEIERKWLVNKNNIPLNLDDFKSWEIEQAYISFSPTIRIRRIANLNKHFLTMKSASKDNGLSREEFEIEINNEQYQNLLSKKEGLVLNKTRYLINVDKYIYELDLFHNEYEGLCYVEVEFKSIEEAENFKAPNWFEKELTTSRLYTNSSLARKLIKIK